MTTIPNVSNFTAREWHILRILLRMFDACGLGKMQNNIIIHNSQKEISSIRRIAARDGMALIGYSRKCRSLPASDIDLTSQYIRIVLSRDGYRRGDLVAHESTDIARVRFSVTCISKGGKRQIGCVQALILKVDFHDIRNASIDYIDYLTHL